MGSAAASVCVLETPFRLSALSLGGLVLLLPGKILAVSPSELWGIIPGSFSCCFPRESHEAILHLCS